MLRTGTVYDGDSARSRLFSPLMWSRLVGCAMLAGCSLPPLPEIVDGPGDGSGGPDGGGDCFQAWMDHTVRIDPTVKEVIELSIQNVNSRNPWLSDDGLRMYFARDPAAGSQSRIFFTNRTLKTERFTTPVLVPNLNSTDDGDDGRPWLIQDEQTIVLPIERMGHTRLAMTTRSGGVFGTPTADHLMAVNDFGSGHNDPFLSPDGLRLYLDTDPTQGQFQLRSTKRSSTSDDFGTPSQVRGTETPSPGTAFAGSLGDPALYHGERLLVFSSIIADNSADLFYATQDPTLGSFGTPTQIPVVNNVDTAEMDIILTADGCELYFASTRTRDNGEIDGKYHIYHATVIK
jgi:WD40 repeat protein